MAEPALTASFVTLSGAGFAQPARHSFADRCRAAAAAGFAAIGLHTEDVEALATGGVGLRQIADTLADNGLAVGEIEFLSGWAVGAGSGPLPAERVAYRIADTLGGDHLSAGEFGGPSADFNPVVAAERLAEVAGRAAEHGLRVAVEAFAWSAIADVSTALDLLGRTGTAEVGLLIDVWHFFNTGATPADIAGIDPTRIAAVQLNDGPRVHEDYLAKARATRWLPGDGELDVTGLVVALLAAGYTGPWCVEVSYPEFRELDVADAARLAHDKAAAVLASAGV